MSRGEAYARIQAACDARDQGKDIFVLARTDALIHGWEEAMTRAKEFKRIGVDAVFVEALPDREAMRKCVEEVGIPTFANSEFSIHPIFFSVLDQRPIPFIFLQDTNSGYSHRGWQDRKPVSQGSRRVGLLCGRIFLDSCCSQVEEYPRNTRGSQTEHDCWGAAYDSLVQRGLRGRRLQ